MVLDADDAADQLQEALDDQAEKAAEHRFRTRAAIAIGVLAMLLAITSLGGENATKTMINANILASDAFAFYQAKNIRQTENQLAADQLQAALLLHESGAGAEARQAIQATIDRAKATVARYESEPDPTDPTNPLKGEGKVQLLARAREFERQRDRAQEQDPNFDYATSLFQIAIVLGSVAIVAISRRLLWLALGLGGVATLLMINGFFLFVHLPIGD
jgi:hypothetical protein